MFAQLCILLNNQLYTYKYWTEIYLKYVSILSTWHTVLSINMCRWIALLIAYICIVTGLYPFGILLAKSMLIFEKYHKKYATQFKES